ncbi:Uncharacterised protein [Mycobacteroides abscessus subsp. abscessus]|nr:Uncharacterised protein [Mycobacteroides abscessus subsp. abscessus]
MISGFPDVKCLTDTHDRCEAVFEGRGSLGRDQRVILAVILAALGVTDNDIGDTQLGQEGAADLTGVRARVIYGQVLCAVGKA